MIMIFFHLFKWKHEQLTDLAFTCPDVSQVQKYNISTCSTLSKSRLETALLWSQEEGQVPMESKLLWPSTLGSLKGRWFHNVIMLNIVFCDNWFQVSIHKRPMLSKVEVGEIVTRRFGQKSWNNCRLQGTGELKPSKRLWNWGDRVWCCVELWQDRRGMVLCYWTALAC